MPKSTQKRKSRQPTQDRMDTDVQPREKLLKNNSDDALIFGEDFRLSLSSPERLIDHFDSGVECGASEEEEAPKKPAWSDEDDDGIDVGDALQAQNRKLPTGGINQRDNKYSDLLKHKFETIVGTPSWAKLKRKADDENEVLRTVGFVTKSQKLSLPAESVEYKQVKDLNCETYSEGPFINCVEFHPSASVGLVGGGKGIATLFAVDGKKNNKLHSVAFEKFNIMCAKFVKNGDEAILGSRSSHIFAYDLIAAKATRFNLPPGLTQCKNFVVSPNSQIMAVAGKWGEVHLLSTVTKERIATLKQDGDIGALEYNADGSCLFGHSAENGEVTIWDINTRRVQHKFVDDGCLHGSALTISSSNQFVACGSAQGVVNLYEMTDVFKTQHPKPRKTIMNLTTKVSSLKFNPTSEILALASADIKNSVKLFHIGSGHVFSNFPSFQTKLGEINCFNFSPASGYFALGNRSSVVTLFRLKHFKNY